MYSSAVNDEIFQTKPPFSKPSQFSPKGWTETIEGYQKEAKKLTTCIINNRKLLGRSYTWFLTIYIRQIMSPNDVAALWKKACRNLKQKGIIALWIREPTKAGKVHYHLLVSNQISKKELALAVELSMPSRKAVGWHKMILPCDGRNQLAYYITKAKIKGTVRGKLVADRYASKRLLFKAGLKLKKYGTIGKFWVRPKKELWKEVQEKERRIAEGLADPGVRRVARRACELVNGFVRLGAIERSFGYWANEPGVQNWIKRLDAEDNA